jgi:hypothetical protein
MAMPRADFRFTRRTQDGKEHDTWGLQSVERGIREMNVSDRFTVSFSGMFKRSIVLPHLLDC